jgi:hypothetical protein
MRDMFVLDVLGLLLMISRRLMLVVVENLGEEREREREAYRFELTGMSCGMVTDIVGRSDHTRLCLCLPHLVERRLCNEAVDCC